MMRLTSMSSSRGESYALAERQHQPFQLRHVERGGGAFARHVGNQDAQPVAGQPEEVIVVPAHFARGHAERRDPEARHVDRTARQERHLDRAGDAQLFLEPLLLRGRLHQPFDAAGHLVERARQLAELIVRVHVDPVREVAMADPLGAGEQLVDRARDRSRERKPHAERDAFDDQEEPGDQEQHGDRDDAERHVAEGDLLRLRQPPIQLARPVAERDADAAVVPRVPVVAVEEDDALAEERRPGAVLVRARIVRQDRGLSGLLRADDRRGAGAHAGLLAQRLDHLVVDRQIAHDVAREPAVDDHRGDGPVHELDARGAVWRRLFDRAGPALAGDPRGHRGGRRHVFPGAGLHALRQLRRRPGRRQVTRTRPRDTTSMRSGASAPATGPRPRARARSRRPPPQWSPSRSSARRRSRP